MMSAGAQSSQEAETPNPLTHYLYWDRAGRKGQRCRIVESGAISVTIEFADGFRTITDQRAIRRIPDDRNDEVSAHPGTRQG